MKVVINPLPHQRRTGLTSLREWRNPEIERAIRDLFCCAEYEEIEQIEIDAEGITARLTTKPVKPKEES